MDQRKKMKYRKKGSRFRSFFFTLKFALKNIPWQGIGLVLFGGLLLIFFTQQWFMGYASLHWQTTEGKIVTSEAFRCHRRRLPDGYQAKIVYEYTVKGVLYSSDTITFTTDWFYAGCGDAEKTMSEYPLGKHVLVHYDPESPENAVLQPGGTSFGSIGISVLMLVVGIKLLVDAKDLRQFRRPKRIGTKKVFVKG